METYYGKSVNTGIVSGKVVCFQKKNIFSMRMKADDVDAEYSKFLDAVKEVEAGLTGMITSLSKEGRKEECKFAEAHKLILTAPEFLDNCRMKIKEEGLDVKCAVYEAGELLAAHFEKMADAFMRERSADIRGVVQQLLNVLGGGVETFPKLTEPVIIVAEELTPTETLGLDKNMVLAMVVKKGSMNSHSAILARLWNIPALISIEMKSDWDGQNAIVDGEKGVFYLNPTKEVIDMIERQQEVLTDKQDNLKEYIGLSNESRSGKKIEIYANVGSVEDVHAAQANDAGGIGLFRTEFMFMGRDTAPTEEEQFEIYRDVAIAMKGKPVIIRTMDIGADKQVEYISLPGEDNPALGIRGIRLSLAYEELFKIQLRAIMRAAAFGDVRIMFPMVTAINEVSKSKRLIDQIKAELKLQNYRYGDVKIGVMIETPAAAILSDVFAKEVDFFSIGTNDLTQYALAADRQNPALSVYCEESKEAVLRLIKQTIENAHVAGIPVGICGELAGDVELTAQFLEWGVDELSLSPSKILEVRKAVRACN